MTEKEFKRVSAVLKEYEALQQNKMLLKQFLMEWDDHFEDSSLILKLKRPYANEMGVLTREITLNNYDRSIVEKVLEVLRIEFLSMGTKQCNLTVKEEDEQ